VIDDESLLADRQCDATVAKPTLVPVIDTPDHFFDVSVLIGGVRMMRIIIKTASCHFHTT
jgi:hypothetical protein